MLSRVHGHVLLILYMALLQYCHSPQVIMCTVVMLLTLGSYNYSIVHGHSTIPVLLTGAAGAATLDKAPDATDPVVNDNTIHCRTVKQEI